MRGRHLLGLAAVALVVAFFVPTAHFGIVFFGGSTSDDIFLWDSWRSVPREWRDVLSLAGSLVPCALFVAAWLIAFFWPRRLTRGLTWALWAAVAWIAWPWFYFDYVRSITRVGYYLWVASFVLLGYALQRTRRERLAASGGQPPVAAR